MTPRDMTVTQRDSASVTHRDGDGDGDVRPRYARTGAERPLGTNEVVAAYVRGRTEAGLATDARLRGMCGRYAKKILARGEWDPDTLLEAVRRFGATNRSPRFVSEWCSQIVTEGELREHEAAKDDRALAPSRGLRSIAEILGAA